MNFSKYIISIEPTPNPDSFKINLTTKILDDMWECMDQDKAAESYLAEWIWTELGDEINSVFFHENMVVIAKKTESEWAEIEPKAADRINAFFESNLPVFRSSKYEAALEEGQSVEHLIAEVIRDFIQPAIASHGGFIRFHKIEVTEDGILVYVSMHGSCSGCPSSEETLKYAIENMLKFYIPDIKEVRLI